MPLAAAFPTSSASCSISGVDINARYGNDLTVLMWAAGYSDEAGTQDMEKVIKLLLDRGARIDDQDNRGRTPLMIAAELNHTVAVELLLAHGADKGLRDKQGKSAADLTTLDGAPREACRDAVER